ncbi:single-stranded DNA-dependent ATPase [Aureococcus anophagefferens]|nr:single-stranded DNA-dependent ATPase [Aureococcus anophagefferens]
MVKCLRGAGRAADAGLLVYAGDRRVGAAPSTLRHACVEGGDADSFGAGADAWKGVADLDGRDKAYYDAWDALLDLEAAKGASGAALLGGARRRLGDVDHALDRAAGVAATAEARLSSLERHDFVLAPTFDAALGAAAPRGRRGRGPRARARGGDGCAAARFGSAFAALNGDQRRAAELALGATDYGLVLGMPGTGKTSTVEFVVRCFVAAGLRVLVASYSHAAVDHLLEKLLDSGVSERCVARVAAPSAAERVAPRLRGHVVGRPGFDSVPHIRGALQARVVGARAWPAPRAAS